MNVHAFHAGVQAQQPMHTHQAHVAVNPAPAHPLQAHPLQAATLAEQMHATVERRPYFHRHHHLHSHLPVPMNVHAFHAGVQAQQPMPTHQAHVAVNPAPAHPLQAHPLQAATLAEQIRATVLMEEITLEEVTLAGPGTMCQVTRETICFSGEVMHRNRLVAMLMVGGSRSRCG